MSGAPANEASIGAARIALIHATRLAIDPVEQAFRSIWPDAERFHLLEDSLSRDRVTLPTASASMQDRFIALSRYAQSTGATGILYTCSAFGPEIDGARRAVPLPTLKPNEAMLIEALGIGRRIGLLATFEPSLQPIRDELTAAAAERGLTIEVELVFVPEAMDALARGDSRSHDERIAAAAARTRSLDVLLLAQFSMARAKSAVADAVAVPVLTSPEAAVAALRLSLKGVSS